MQKYRVVGGFAHVTRHDGGCSRTVFRLPPGSTLIGDLEDAEFTPDDDHKIENIERVNKQTGDPEIEGVLRSDDAPEASSNRKRRPPHADKMIRDYEDKSTDFPDIGRH